MKSLRRQGLLQLIILQHFINSKSRFKIWELFFTNSVLYLKFIIGLAQTPLKNNISLPDVISLMDFECQTSPFLHCTWWHHQYYLKRSCPFHLPLFIKKICDYSSTVFRSTGLWLLMTDYDRRVRHGRQWETYMMRMAAVHDDGSSNNWGHVQQLKHPKNLNRNSNMYTNTFFGGLLCIQVLH